MDYRFYSTELRQLNEVLSDFDVPIREIRSIRFFRLMLALKLRKFTQVFEKTVISILQVVDRINS